MPVEEMPNLMDLDDDSLQHGDSVEPPAGRRRTDTEGNFDQSIKFVKGEDKQDKQDKHKKGNKGGDDRHTSQHGKEAGKEGLLRPLVQELLIKLSLKTAQMSREHQAILSECLIFDSSHPLIQGIKSEGQLYAKICRTKGKGHGMGPPHPYLYRKAVKLALQEVEKDEHKEKIKDEVKDWLKEKNDMMPKTSYDIQKTVKCFRLEKCYRQDKTKMIYTSLDLTDRYMMTALFQSLGGVVQMGKAAPGGLETLLQQVLEGK